MEGEIVSDGGQLRRRGRSHEGGREKERERWVDKEVVKGK